MEKLLIINGSPRAPKSNSKGYGEMLANCLVGKMLVDTVMISRTNHQEIYKKVKEYDEVVFVYPLYVDGIPSTLLEFLKGWEKQQGNKMNVHVIVNCGFLENEQNAVSIKMIHLFCKENKLSFGSSLSIGSGEAILGTPLKIFVERKMQKLAKAIIKKQAVNLGVQMPFSKKLFVKVSTKHWIKRGEEYGITKEAMESMEVE